jgi:hypothetical protein
MVRTRYPKQSLLTGQSGVSGAKIAFVIGIAVGFVLLLVLGMWEAYLFHSGARQPDSASGLTTALTLKGQTVYVRQHVSLLLQYGFLSVWGMLACTLVVSNRFFHRDDLWTIKLFFAALFVLLLTVFGMGFATGGEVPFGILSR